MIVLYSALLSFLNVVKFFLYRRSRSLEKRYKHLVVTGKKLANQPIARRGNSNHNDPYEAARQSFELGRLVHARDRLEAKHFAWQRRYERFDGWVNGVRAWRGKKLPYLCGIVDVSSVLYVLHHLGLGRIDLSQLVQTVQEMISKS